MDTSNQKCWPVVNYAKWTNQTWIERPVNKEKCSLLINGSQLFVINEGIALESVCLVGGAGVVKLMQANESLGILIENNKNMISKFKIRFAGDGEKTNLNNCYEVVKALRKFVPVTEHPSHKGKQPVTNDVVKTLPEIVNELLEKDSKLISENQFTLPNTAIKDTLHSCILDPGFPSLVAKIEKMLENQDNDDDVYDFNI